MRQELTVLLDPFAEHQPTVSRLLELIPLVRGIRPDQTAPVDEQEVFSPRLFEILLAIEVHSEGETQIIVEHPGDVDPLRSLHLLANQQLERTLGRLLDLDEQLGAGTERLHSLAPASPIRVVLLTLNQASSDKERAGRRLGPFRQIKLSHQVIGTLRELIEERRPGASAGGSLNGGSNLCHVFSRKGGEWKHLHPTRG